MQKESMYSYKNYVQSWLICWINLRERSFLWRMTFIIYILYSISIYNISLQKSCPMVCINQQYSVSSVVSALFIILIFKLMYCSIYPYIILIISYIFDSKLIALWDNHHEQLLKLMPFQSPDRCLVVTDSWDLRISNLICQMLNGIFTDQIHISLSLMLLITTVIKCYYCY